MCMLAFPWSPEKKRPKKEEMSDLRKAFELGIRIDLLKLVTGNAYELMAYCGKCERFLSPAEIYKGFVADTEDRKTECVRCAKRFDAHLILMNSDTKITLTFMSPAATLAALPLREWFSPADLCQHDMAVYHNAIFHFGSLQRAYLHLGLKYREVETFENWARYSAALLGKVPDRLIATVAGVPVGRVKKTRETLKIARFRGYPAHNYEPVRVQ